MNRLDLIGYRSVQHGVHCVFQWLYNQTIDRRALFSHLRQKPSA